MKKSMSLNGGKIKNYNSHFDVILIERKKHLLYIFNNYFLSFR